MRVAISTTSCTPRKIAKSIGGITDVSHLYYICNPPSRSLMSPIKKQTKRYTVTLHLTEGKDALLIRWCRSVERGKRMGKFKDALNQYLFADFLGVTYEEVSNPTAA